MIRMIGCLFLMAECSIGCAVEGQGASEMAKEGSHLPFVEVAPTQSKTTAKKKARAHFAGSKRPAQNTPGYQPPEPSSKKSRKIKNQWVRSKTQPKKSSSS